MSLRFLSSSFRGFAGVLATVSVLAAAGVQPSLAQQPPGLTTAAFIANPSTLLQLYPNGGPQLISAIRDLAVSDPATLQPILQLLANANHDQKGGIGAGLAQAARIVVRSNPAYSQQIQQAVAQTKDNEVIQAYTQTTGDTQLGGVGAGPGGGGAVGGQTNPLFGPPGSTGPAQPILGGSWPTSPFSYTSSVSGTGIITGDNSTTPGSGSNSPVSQ